MFKKGRKSGTVTFSVTPGNGASKVFVVGDFTNWQPVPMRRRSGTFSASVPVPPGRHEYKFIVDGQWRTDPDNSDWVLNPYDSLNAIATVRA